MASNDGAQRVTDVARSTFLQLYTNVKEERMFVVLSVAASYLEGLAVLPDVSPGGAVYVPVQLGSVDVAALPVRDRIDNIYRNNFLSAVSTSV